MTQTKDNHSQQVSGSLASVEETKQSGMACNSADKSPQDTSKSGLLLNDSLNPVGSNDKPFCLENCKTEVIYDSDGDALFFFEEEKVKQSLALLKEDFIRELHLVWSGIRMECPDCHKEVKCFVRISEVPRIEVCLNCVLNSILRLRFGKSLMPTEVKK